MNGLLAGDTGSGNRSGDDVGGRNRNARLRSKPQHKTRAEFGGEALGTVKLGYFLAYRPHDPPSAGQSSHRYRQVCADHHPQRHMENRAQHVIGKQQHRDNAHGFLGVVGAVHEAEESRGNKLQEAIAGLGAGENVVP